MPSPSRQFNLCEIFLSKRKLAACLISAGIGSGLCAAKAQDAGTDPSRSASARYVRVFAGATNDVCIGYLKFLRDQKTKPSVCAALSRSTPFMATEIPWQRVDYRPYVEGIERVYEAYEGIQPFSFAQRELGPKYPGLRNKHNPNFYDEMGDIFWSKYGDTILHEFETGHLSVERAKIQLGPDAKEYDVFRVPLWEPRSLSQAALKPLTCGAHADVPSYSIFADRQAAPELDRFLSDAGRDANIVAFKGTLYYGWFDEDQSGKGSILLQKLVDAHRPPAESACTIGVGF